MTPERREMALSRALELAEDVAATDALGRFRLIRLLMEEDLWVSGQSARVLAARWKIALPTVEGTSSAASHSLRVDSAPVHFAVSHSLEEAEDAATASRSLARRLATEASSGEPRELASIAQAYAAASSSRMVAVEKLARLGGAKPEDVRPVASSTDDDAKPELDELTVEELEALRVLELGKIRRSGA